MSVALLDLLTAVFSRIRFFRTVDELNFMNDAGVLPSGSSPGCGGEEVRRPSPSDVVAPLLEPVGTADDLHSCAPFTGHWTDGGRGRGHDGPAPNCLEPRHESFLCGPQGVQQR